MMKKTRLLLAVMTAVLFAAVGTGFAALAKTGDVWLTAYRDADEVIAEKDQTGSAHNEFLTTSAAEKATDWTLRVPQFDGEDNVLSYYGGATVGNHAVDAKVGSAATVASSTTKLKIARAFTSGRYRYAYPVQLDGLEVYANLSQLTPGESLRFTFGASYQNFAHYAQGKEHGLNGIALEFHYDQGTENANLRFAVRTLHNYGQTLQSVEWGQYMNYDEAIGIDSGDEGGKTVKITFALDAETGRVTCTFANHRNHPQDTTPTRTFSFLPSASNASLMVDDDGNTWVGVNSFADKGKLTPDGNNTDAYSTFAVQVSDAKRKAYEEGELAAAKTALAAYSKTAVEEAVIETDEARRDWKAKQQAAISAVAGLRASDRCLLEADRLLAEANEAMGDRLMTAAEKQVHAQLTAYKEAPLSTIDEIHAALDKRDAIGDFSAFENAAELSAARSAKDTALLTAADGLLQERMEAAAAAVEAGIASYQERLSAKRILNSVTDRDLLEGEALQLAKHDAYRQTLEELSRLSQAFAAKLDETNYVFTDSTGKEEESVNDLAFTEEGMQLTFTGSGHQIYSQDPIDIKRGARVVFSVDDWAYLMPGAYNPNGMAFFVSPSKNTNRGPGSIAFMFFLYEDSMNVMPLYGVSNEFLGVTNCKRIEENDGSYVELVMLLNESKKRYEFRMNYYAKDGTVIDSAQNYIGYREADADIGGIDIDENTFADGAYLYMTSWMAIDDWRDESGQPLPSDSPLIPQSLFNTMTFKVFGNNVYDEAFRIEYIESIAVKEGSLKTVYQVGEALDLTNAKLVVTMESKKQVEVALTRNLVKGFDSKAEGTCELTITYEGFATTVTVTIQKKSVEPDPDPGNDPQPGPGEEPEEKRGCRGNLASNGLTALALVLLAAGGVLIRKKKF